MFRAEVWDKKIVADSYSAAALIGERKCQATENKGKRQLRVLFFSILQLQKEDVKRHDVRYFGHRGLISLTRSWVSRSCTKTTYAQQTESDVPKLEFAHAEVVP